MNDTARELGSALGIALLGSVLNQQYRANVADAVLGLPAQIAAGVQHSVAFTQSPALAQAGEAGERLATAARHAFVDGVSGAVLVAAAVLVVAAAGVFLRAPAHESEATRPGAGSGGTHRESTRWPHRTMTPDSQLARRPRRTYRGTSARWCGRSPRSSGNALVGVYTTGSLALGGFTPGRSDIDLMAVVDGHQAPDTCLDLAVRLDHQRMPCPASGLEFVLYPSAIVTTPSTDAGYLLNLNTGPKLAPLADLDSTSAPAFWFVLDPAISAQSGEAVIGPPAAVLFRVPPAYELLPVVLLRSRPSNRTAATFSTTSSSTPVVPSASPRTGAGTRKRRRAGERRQHQDPSPRSSALRWRPTSRDGTPATPSRHPPWTPSGRRPGPTPGGRHHGGVILTPSGGKIGVDGDPRAHPPVPARQNWSPRGRRPVARNVSAAELAQALRA